MFLSWGQERHKEEATPALCEGGLLYGQNMNVIQEKMNCQRLECACDCGSKKVRHRRSVYSTTCLPLILTENNQQAKHKRQDSGLTFALQALLDRHEAYVKESQAEQARLSTYINDLEHEKISLQDANHKIVVENRELLQKLEQLNTDFSESDRRVHDLEHLLQDCEQEIRRLNGLTRQTQDLELRVIDMERERAELSKQFADSKDETRSTIARWKESERRVRELEQEVQRIEWAAKIDREKHESIVARVERDRALERELCLSEGRLKATAAVQNLKSNGPKEKQVVSNFVRDILQDNANLQAGIAELRELLQSSNDEVQNLREQVMMHQPVQDDSPSASQRSLPLSEELALSRSPPRQVQREVHVHHHYHPKAGSRKEKTPLRRSSRRKALITSTPSPSPSTPVVSSPLIRSQRHGSGAAVPFDVRTKDPRANRWSMQSTATASTYISSMASSPRSYYDRNSSIFDRMERDEESSRPTSPDSFILSSPMPFKNRLKGDDQALSDFEEEDISDDIPTPSLEQPGVDVQTLSDADSHDQSDDISLPINETEPIPELELTPRPSFQHETSREAAQSAPHVPDDRIPEKPLPPETLSSKDGESGRISTNKMEIHSVPLHTEEDGVSGTKSSLCQIPEIRPSIRRRNSHDSLVSISGMDIHLAQGPDPRSALALLRGSSANKHHFAPSPAPTRKVSAPQPLAAVTEYTAVSRPGLDNAPSASMVALSGIRSADSTSSATQPRGLIGSVGGWVRGKWGVAPTKSVADLRSTADTSGLSSLSVPPYRPPAKQFVSSPDIVKSSAVSQHSVATTSTSHSKPSTGKRSASWNALEVPQHTAAITISNHGRKGSSCFSASPFGGGRTPGINQSGPIPGFAAVVAARRAPIEVEATRIDVNSLKESLCE